MSTNEKAVARTTAVSKTTSASRHSTTLLHWLVSLPTTAACIASLGAPIVSVLVGLIEGGRL
ncbi:MAG: hypothetical protein V5B31_14905 [Candidatus Accumulibacter propinquus]|jgi:hypothetical protein|uniref:hypothetical protein n=1 Tax=Candidatus Accumulibacter propinquus TaxID=2954380 RepID=UPI002FC3D7AF